MFRRLGIYKIDVLINRLSDTLRLHILQHLSIYSNLSRNTLDLFQINLSIPLGYQLCRSVSDAIDIYREDAHRTGRNSHRTLRELHATYLKLHILPGRQLLQSLIVINENKTALIFRTKRPAKMRIIALLYILTAWEARLHRSQYFCIIMHKEMQFAEHEIMRILLSEFSQWRLEIIRLYRHIIIIGSLSALIFIQINRTTIVQITRHHRSRIGSAMIHIISKKIASATQLDDSQRIRIFRINIRTAMVRCHHASTQFAGEVRIGFIPLVNLRLLFAKLFGSDCRTASESLEVESLVVITSRLLQASLPETIGIVAIKRNHLAERHRCFQFRPSRTGIERQIETYLLGYLLQRHQITSPATIFIIKLCRYNRTAILPLQSLHLRENLAIQQGGIFQKDGILLSHPAALGKHPVGDTAIAHLTMAERSQTENHRNLFLLANLEESTKIALSTPVEDTFHFLHMVPEHIGSNHGNATLLHLPYFLSPLILRDSRIMYLAHHRHHSLTIENKAMLIPSDRLLRNLRLGSHRANCQERHRCK